jgi:hypothetical protein
MATAELVTIGERIIVCRDPTDDKFLELAVSGRAELIITGDARHCRVLADPARPRHPHRCLSEYDLRYNQRMRRGFNDMDRMVAAVRSVEGKRLTYRRAH